MDSKNQQISRWWHNVIERFFFFLFGLFYFIFSITLIHLKKHQETLHIAYILNWMLIDASEPTLYYSVSIYNICVEWEFSLKYWREFLSDLIKIAKHVVIRMHTLRCAWNANMLKTSTSSMSWTLVLWWILWNIYQQLLNTSMLKVRKVT